MQGKDAERIAGDDGHMKNALRLIAGLAMIGVVPSLAAAADVSNGLKLAEHWCAACHLVSPTQKQAIADVATFADIAKRTDARALTLLLAKPHGQMPDLTLSQPEIADLVAYTESLGPNPVPPDTKPEAPARGLSGAIAPAR